MTNEYYGVASTPMDDYLAHYGVRGMKWGVRKAIKTGDSQKLSKQYAKAQKKLEKLNARAANVSKYKKKALKYGAGAALTGAAAIAGPSKVASGATKAAGAITEGAGRLDAAAGRLLSKSKNKTISGIGNRLASLGDKAITAGSEIKNKTSGNVGTAVEEWGKQEHNVAKSIHGGLGRIGLGSQGNQLHNKMNAAGLGDKTVSNSTLVRLGAGAASAGLGIAAARNAYRAKTAQKKADRFRAEMNTAFKGTQYDSSKSTPKKRRRK